MGDSLCNLGALVFSASVMMGLVLPGCSGRLGPVRVTQNGGSISYAHLEQTKECVADYGQQMAPGRIDLDATVNVNEDGDLVGVRLDGIPKTAPDFGACLRHVLREMPIAEQPFREGVKMLDFSRKHAGDSQDALVGFINVIPGVPIVGSEVVLEAEGYTVVLAVTVKVVPKLEELIDIDEATLKKIGQMALDTLGYDEIMRRAEQQGWVKRVPIEQAQSMGDKMFIGDGVSPVNVQEIVKESFKLVMTKTAPVAVTVSQLDTPAPGPGDALAVGIFAVSLVAVGAVSVYIYVKNKNAEVPTTSVDAPAPQPQQPQPPAPPPSPPPPPPPPPRETCEANSELNKIIRCDDPKISHYNDESENAAFRKIVSSRGQGLRKEKNEAGATSGPCFRRGGFHTNVKRGKDYVASIMGCNCCDDSNGKAVKSQKTLVR